MDATEQARRSPVSFPLHLPIPNSMQHATHPTRKTSPQIRPLKLRLPLENMLIMRAAHTHPPLQILDPPPHMR